MAQEAVKPKTESGPPREGGHPQTEITESPRVGLLDVGISVLTFLGENAQLTGSASRYILRGGVNPKDLLTQMSAIGVDFVWIILANTFATGAVFAIYITSLAKQIGFPEFVGGTLAYAFLNELGPMLAGVALASRCGSAIAAEIGSMVVTEQVDALRAMAVSPTRYLVAPRMLAAILMMPFLTVIGDLAGVIGGWLSSLNSGVPGAVYWSSVYKYTHPEDLTRGLIKSVVFGYLVGIVACQQGLRTKGGATGVGRATTGSVVLCVFLIFVADFFLAQVLTQIITLRP